jgi:hypothetical protein
VRLMANWMAWEGARGIKWGGREVSKVGGSAGRRRMSRRVGLWRDRSRCG